MDKRLIVKNLVSIAITVGAGKFVTNALEANLPQTKRLHAAEVTGILVGGIAADQLRPQTDAMVDAFFDARAARKIQK